MPIPLLDGSTNPSESMDLPSITMSPSSGFSNPAMQHRVVVLPQPLGPKGGQHFSLVYLQVNVINCHHLFKALKQVADLYECHQNFLP